jgi:urea carboxylase
VAAGQPLIVVEAMKMELAVTAPRAGVVKRISCRQGRPVGPGDALLWLEKAV